MKLLFTIVLFGLMPLTSCTMLSAVKGERSNIVGWAYNDPSNGGFEKNIDRKVAYRANITAEVKNCDTAATQVMAVANNYNGFILHSGTSYSTIKVPAAQFKAAISALEKIGKVKGKHISGNDITDEYNDYAMRLENAELARKRYLELLDKASTVEEILKVEKELERLNADIEKLKGDLASINKDTDFSSITVNYSQKQKLGVLGYVFVGTYKGIRWLFVRG